MSTERPGWSEVEPALDRALDLEGEERSRYLEALERDRPEIFARVGRLLEAVEEGTELPIDRPLVSVAGELMDRLPISRLGAALEVGTIVGHWRISGEIGSGGMGRVYLAESLDGGERVAIKVHGSHLDLSQELRFRRERELLGQLGHPAIVELLDHGVLDDGRSYLVLPYVEGPTITEHCRRRRLPLRDRVRLFRRVCEAVAHAHSLGVVHRDLKPSNVLVEESADGAQPKVLDFGVAHEEHTTALTQTGQILGTPGYMSPEQASGSRGLDHRSDLYSLGVLLYEMLSDHRPFEGLSAAEILVAVADGDSRPLREVAPEVPDALHAVVHRCLEVDPTRRFASVAELVDTLREIDLARTTRETRARTGRSRARGLAMAVLAIAALVLAGFGWWLLLRRAAELEGRVSEVEESVRAAAGVSLGAAREARREASALAEDVGGGWLGTGARRWERLGRLRWAEGATDQALVALERAWERGSRSGAWLRAWSAAHREVCLWRAWEAWTVHGAGAGGLTAAADLRRECAALVERRGRAVGAERAATAGSLEAELQPADELLWNELATQQWASAGDRYERLSRSHPGSWRVWSRRCLLEWTLYVLDSRRRAPPVPPAACLIVRDAGPAAALADWLQCQALVTGGAPAEALARGRAALVANPESARLHLCVARSQLASLPVDPQATVPLEPLRRAEESLIRTRELARGELGGAPPLGVGLVDAELAFRRAIHPQTADPEGLRRASIAAAQATVEMPRCVDGWLLRARIGAWEASRLEPGERRLAVLSEAERHRARAQALARPRSL